MCDSYRIDRGYDTKLKHKRYMFSLNCHIYHIYDILQIPSKPSHSFGPLYNVLILNVCNIL